MIIGDKGLDNLIVWKKAVDLVQLVYREIIPNLPVEERYSLTQQLRRSSISISANIAEGYGRYYYQDHVRFCYIARGSLEETFSHIRVAITLGFISANNAGPVLDAISEIRKILNGYINFIKKSKQGEHEPALNSGKFISEIQEEYLIKSNLCELEEQTLE